MDNSIIVAIITGVFASIGYILTYVAGQRKTDQQQTEQMQQIKSENEKHLVEVTAMFNQAIAVIETKLDTLEKKQDKHNNIIERTYKLEERMSVAEDRQKTANHRIDDLEKVTSH